MTKRRKFISFVAAIIFVASVLTATVMHYAGRFDEAAGIEPPSFLMTVLSIIVVVLMFAGMAGIAALIYRATTQPQKPWERKVNFYRPREGGRHGRKIYIHP